MSQNESNSIPAPSLILAHRLHNLSSIEFLTMEFCMNTFKRLALSIGVIGLVLSGLVGCAKGGGGGSGNVSGDASISGSTVTSAQTVNGQQLTVTISNLQSMSNSYYYGYGSGSVSATVAINGQSGQLQTSVYTTVPPLPPASYSGAQASTIGNSFH